MNQNGELKGYWKRKTGLIPKWAPKCSEVRCEMTKKGCGDRSIARYYAIIWLATAPGLVLVCHFWSSRIYVGLVGNYFRNILSKSEKLTWFWQKTTDFGDRNHLFHGQNPYIFGLKVSIFSPEIDQKSLRFCSKSADFGWKTLEIIDKVLTTVNEKRLVFIVFVIVKGNKTLMKRIIFLKQSPPSLLLLIPHPTTFTKWSISK